MADLKTALAELIEALRLADAMLSGANMNARVVERKVRAALSHAAAMLPAAPTQDQEKES